MVREKEMTAIQAARRLRVGLDYLYSLLWARKLPGRKTGNRWRIPAAAVEARLKEKRVSAR